MCFIPRSLKLRLVSKTDSVSWTFQISTNLETNQSQVYCLIIPAHKWGSQVWFMKKLFLSKKRIFEIFFKMTKKYLELKQGT